MIDMNNDLQRKLEELLDIASPEEIIKRISGDAVPTPKRGVKGSRGRPRINRNAHQQVVSVMAQLFLCSRWPNNLPSAEWAIHQTSRIGIEYQVTKDANPKPIEMTSPKTIHARFYDAKNADKDSLDWYLMRCRVIVPLCAWLRIYPHVLDVFNEIYTFGEWWDSSDPDRDFFGDLERDRQKWIEIETNVGGFSKTEGLDGSPWRQPFDISSIDGMIFHIPPIAKATFDTLRCGMRALEQTIAPGFCNDEEPEVIGLPEKLSVPDWYPRVPGIF
jgi:hypothetical protein